MKWPDRAFRAVAYLFRPFNDIDVYVEDSVSRGMYEVLLGRMLENGARVSRVHQLGDRERVVAACAADQLPSNRRRLYLIDGDMDLLLDVPPPHLKHLYRLGVYTSENLLFSKEAVLEIAFESIANIDRASVDTVFEFDAFMAEVADQLSTLFVIYAVVFAMQPGVATVGVNVMTLCTQQRGMAPRLDHAKVSARVTTLEGGILCVCPPADIAPVRTAVERKIDGSVEAARRYISGKTYLLPLVYHRLRERARFEGTIEQLKVRLARYAALDLDPGLLDAVTACSREAI